MPIAVREIARVAPFSTREIASRAEVGTVDALNGAALTTGAPSTASFSVTTQLAMPLPGVEHVINTTTRIFEQPMEGAQCCAHAVASAVETRMVNDRGMNPAATPLDPRAHFAQGHGKTGMFNACDVLEDGVNSTAGVQRAKAQFLGKRLPAQMVEELQKNTPLMVEINIGSTPPQGPGIYRLTGSRISHAVCIVGFGTDPQSNEPYWLAKNSFGAMWGEGGYARFHWGDPDVIPERSVFALRSIDP